MTPPWRRGISDPQDIQGRQVASRQEGPEQSCPSRHQHDRVLNKFICEAVREKGQSEKRVLNSTFKTKNIQRPGEKEQSAAERGQKGQKSSGRL